MYPEDESVPNRLELLARALSRIKTQRHEKPNKNKQHDHNHKHHQKLIDSIKTTLIFDICFAFFTSAQEAAVRRDLFAARSHGLVLRLRLCRRFVIRGFEKKFEILENEVEALEMLVVKLSPDGGVNSWED